MNTVVYVDGFNLYYGALKGTPYKWLDLMALSKQLVPASNVISQIKYFTARVSGAQDPLAPKRQHLYLKAIQSYPEIEVHFGSFLAKSIWRPITNLPVANDTISSPDPVVLPPGSHSVNRSARSRVQTLVVGSYPKAGSRKAGKAPKPFSNAVVSEVHTMEEKGSDVNLAVHLLNDAWKDAFSAAVVISNDTDLVEPIRMVTQERGKDVYIVCPGQWSAAPKLVQAATYKRHIRPAMLAVAQLPDEIPNTSVRKPAEW
jgi:uncharacterized LabA/DUF88 family protein